MGDASTTKAPEASKEEPRKEKKLLRVDQIFNRQKRQWSFVKTAKPRTEEAKFQKYSIVVRRIISTKGLVRDERVDIKSAKLAELLRELLRDVGQLELSKNPPEVSPQQLFHAWPGIEARIAEERAKADPDEDFIRDLATAVEFLEQDFGKTSGNLKSLLEFGEITYDLLWALFTPRAVMYTDFGALKEQQAYMFTYGQYHETQQGNYYEINGKMLNHDGEYLGWGWPTFKIPEFHGAKKITSLESYPLSFHEDEAALRTKFVARGRRFLELIAKPVCLEYQGLGVFQDTNFAGEASEKRFAATGRIMTDPVAFYSREPNHHLLIRPLVFSSHRVNPDNLTDDEVMISTHRILGFAFTPKTWGAFSISNMTAVAWDMNAFDKLILEEKKKRMIRQLVQSHRTDESAFDDIVAGKGKGLVGLLSGPPGVGKTLTAEVVAELSCRPLYMVSAGELGTTVSNVDQQLGMVLDITRRWGCVLLIDEADVFLYKRGEAQLERNALVSVFLRRLEYFQGIVVLTTNRRRDIDEAFKSRIHFKFHYPALGEGQRLSIWREMLGSVDLKVGGLEGRMELGDAELGDLAKVPMNGREIKNAVSSAISVVRAGDEPLTVQLVRDVLESLVDEGVSDEE